MRVLKRSCYNSTMYKKPTIARGGKGTQQTFIRGGLRPEVQPLIPSYIRSRAITPANIPFLTENTVTPFVYLPLTNSTNSTNIVLELCITFNCCKCAVLTIIINRKTRKFSRLFHSHKIPLEAGQPALVGLKTEMTDSSTLLFTLGVR